MKINYIRTKIVELVFKFQETMKFEMVNQMKNVFDFKPESYSLNLRAKQK